MTTALCIIDMQYSYEASRHCADQVIREISLARQKKAPIIVVTLSGMGRTLKKVRKALKGYSRVIDVRKDDSDGSAEILEALKKRKVAINKIWICGVNRCECVYNTTTGLLYRGIKVEFLYHATSCDCFPSPCDFKYNFNREGLKVRYLN